MFDSTKIKSGTKIAVTASTISDASSFVFSNYNGLGRRKKECGYKHLRPQEIDDEPFVRQAGRATSAAPVLFKPTHIPNIGTFQDGGLKHNNPVNLALWESRQVWPSIAKPDLVLSLGTGTELHPRSPSAPDFRHIFQDGFIPRICRSFLSSLDGQSAWRDLVNRLDEEPREDYIRLNVSLPNQEPAIDDVEQMDDLRRSVHLQSRDNITAFALLASSFFFELDADAVPQREVSGLYPCRGAIRCRLAGHAINQALKRVHPGSLAFAIEIETVGVIDMNRDICSLCHRYRKRVQFLVRDLGDSVAIRLRGDAGYCRKISAFPHPMSWFIEQQGLDAVFGTADHGTPGKVRCRACTPALGKLDSVKRKGTYRKESIELPVKRQRIS